MAHASPSNPLRSGLAMLGVAALGACHVGYHDDFHGSVVFVSEVEPNDVAAQANYFGFLEPAETVVIQGSVAGVNGIGPDGVDGFQFSSPGGVHVTFHLDSVDAFGDVDVCLYDPSLGVYVACWESPFADESGEFWVDDFGADYQLVVIAANAASAYTLEVSAQGYYYKSADTKSATDAEAGVAGLRVADGSVPTKAGSLEALEAYRGSPRSALAPDESASEAFLELDADGSAHLIREPAAGN